jgi:hypothetical protein
VRPERARRRLVIAAVVAATVLAGCGGGSGGTTGTTRAARVLTYVVPPGTGALVERGETVRIMPEKVTLHVGDTLRIRNDDTADAMVGPYFVEAGKEFSLVYGAPGHYIGVCTLSKSGKFELVVEE